MNMCKPLLFFLALLTSVATIQIKAQDCVPVLVVDSDNTLCQGDQLDLTVSVTLAAGCDIGGYQFNGSGTPGGSTNDAQITVNAASGDYSVTVSIVDNDDDSITCPCIGSETSNVISINPSPPTPTISAVEDEVCEGESIQLQFTGNEVPGAVYEWSGPNGFTSNAQNPLIVNSTQQNSGPYNLTITSQDACESPQSNDLEIVVDPLPNPPNIQDVTVCPSFPATLQASGDGIFRWYAEAVGGELLFEGDTYISPPLTQTTIFYVEAFDSGTGCISERVAVNAVVVEPIPSPVAQDTVICQGDAATLSAIGTGIAGNTLRWYDEPFFGDPLEEDIMPPATHTYTTPFGLLENAIFYVAEFDVNTGCESPRTAIRAIVEPEVPEPIGQDAEICAGTPITLTAEHGGAGTTTGEFYWYDAPIGGELLNIGQNFTPSPNLLESPGTIDFYVEERLNECTSPTRDQVTITILENPPVAVVADTTICFGESAILVAIGSETINWYSDPDANNLLFTGATFETPILTQNSTFYVQQFAEASRCISEVVAVNVEVIPVPGDPNATDLNICNNESAILTVSGSGAENSQLNVYENITDESPIVSAPMPPSEATFDLGQLGAGEFTFYVEEFNVLTNCASNRVPVTIQVSEAPNAPTAPDVFICEGDIATLTASGSGNPNSSINWYADQALTVFLGSGTSLEVSPGTTTSYFATEINEVCESAFTEVIVTVNPLPSDPQAQEFQVCSGDSVELTVTGSGGIFSWFEDANGLNLVETGPNYITPSLTQNTTFYVSETILGTGCTSALIPVNVTVIPVPPAPAVTDITICTNETAQITAIGSGIGTINWYANVNDVDPLQIDEIPPASVTFPVNGAALPLGANTFFVEEDNGTCSSERVPVTVTVIQAPAAPLTQTPTLVCEGETAEISAFSSGNTEGVFNFYDETGTDLLFTGTTFTTPPLFVGTTFQVTEVVGECESEGTAVFIDVNPLPAPPVVVPDSICEGESATLDAQGSGGIFSWFDDPNGSNLLASGPQYTTDPLTQTTTFYVQEQFAETGCVSEIVPITITVLTTPPVPSAEDVEICANESGQIVAAGSGNGTLLWFDTDDLDADPIQTDPMPPSNASLTVSDLPIGTTTFFVAESDGSCTSDRTAVTVTVLEVPDVPTVSVPVAICDGETATLTATSNSNENGTFNWYDATGEELLFTGVVYTTPPLFQTTTFLITEVNNGDCESDTATAVVNVNPLPTPPVVVPDSICEGESATLDAQGSGGIFSWFNDPNGSNLLASGPQYTTDPLTQTTTFYVQEQFAETGCVSEIVPITITVLTTPPVPSAEDVEICANESGQIVAAGSGNGTLLWFDTDDLDADPIQTDPMPPSNASLTVSDLPIGTTTFFVAESDGSCTSDRTAVTVTVLEVPDAPFTQAPTAVCEGETAQIVASSSGNTEGVFNFYDETGTDLLFTGTTFTTPPLFVGTTFQVTEVVGECESEGTAVFIDVNPLPAPPVVVPDSICEGESATLDAQGSGGIFSWFDDPNGSNLLASGPQYTTDPLTQTTTFYVQEQFAETGCVSEIVPITITVLTTPPVPSAEDVEICANESGQIVAAGSGNGTLLWFDTDDLDADPIQTDPMPPSNASLTVSDLPIGTTTFFVAESDGSCTSDRTAVTVTVLEVPDAPFTQAPTAVCEGETAQIVASSSGNTEGVFNFYDETGTDLLFTGTTFTTPPLFVGTTFQVTEVVGECESEGTAVFIDVNPLPAPPVVVPDSICEGESATLDAQGSGGIFSWFDDPNGSNLLASGPQYTTDPLTQTTTFYVQEQFAETGCVSEIVPITITVLTTPPVPSAEDVEICANESGQIVAAGSGNGTLLWFDTDDLDADPIQTDPMPPSNASLTVSDLPIGTTTFFVAESDGSCSSDRTAVTVTVLEVPDAPSILVPIAICEGTSTTLTANSNSDERGTFNWYDATGEELLFSGAFYTTPPLFQTTTFLVTEVNNGCESDTTTAIVSVSPVPSAPLVTPATICEGEPATLNGIPSSVGNLLDWFVDASGSEAIFTGEVFQTEILTQSTTFYVRERDPDTNCESEIIPVQVTVIPIPEAPEVSDLIICQGELAQLTAAGSGQGSILWYDQQEGGTPLETDTMPPTIATFDIGPFNFEGTVLFYVEEQSLSGCVSERTPVTVTVKETPAIPLVDDATICEGTNTTLSASSGGDTEGVFTWFDVNENNLFTGNSYTTPILDSTTVFTVREVLDGCEGPAETVTVTVTPSPEPIVVTPDTICVGESATLEAIVDEGIVVNWYSDPSGSNLLLSGPILATELLTQSTTFWVEAQIPGSGCVSELTPVDVVVLSLPTPPSSSNISICSNETGEILASGSGTGSLIWYNQAEGGVPIQISPMPPANATLNVGPFPPGIQVFYVEESNGSCVSSRTPVTVTILETPSAPNAQGAIICAETSVTLSATSGSNTSGEFRWFDEDGTELLFTGASFTTGILSTTTSYLVREVLDGCESPTTLVTVTVDSLPPLPIVGTDSICEGETATLVALGIEGAVLNWYADPDGSNLLATGPSFTTPELNQTTTYWVQQLTLETGCLSALVPVEVSVLTAPEAPSATEIIVCETEEGEIIGSGSGNAGSVLRWYDTSTGGIALQIDSLGPATSATFTVGPFAPGTYTFYIEEVNIAGCISPRTAVEVVVPPKPAEPSIDDLTICGGESVRITAPGTGIFNWYDAPVGGNLLNRGLSYLTPVLDSTTSFFVSQEIDGCESDREEVVVTVIPIPDAPIISSNSPLCEGDTLQLIGPALEQGFGYSWIGPNGFTSGEQSPIITNVSESDHQGTYTLVITESVNGCVSGETSIVVDISPVPQTPSITSNSPICAGETLRLTASEIANVSSYRWITPSGDTVITPTPILEFTEANEDNSGIFSLSVSANGCPSPSAFIEVQVIGLSSVPELSSNSPVCQGDDLLLSAATVEGAVYNWSGPNGFSSNNQNPVIESISFINAGTYELTISVNSCPTTSPGSINVEVVPAPVLAGVTSNSPVCQGDSLILSAPVIPNVSYSWTGPNGFTSSDPNPLIPEALQASHQGTYLLTVTDSTTGCSTTAETEVFIDSGSGLVVIASSNSPVCEGDAIQLSVNVQPFSSTLAFTWSGPDGFSSSEQNPVIPRVGTGQAGDYEVLVDGSAGCLSGSQNTVSVEVTPGPVVEAGEDQIIIQGEDAQLSATGASVYNWFPPDFLNNPGIPDPVASPPVGEYTYIVTGLDFNGCEGQDSVRLIVEPSTEDLGIMDLFTPNGDGVNDTWMIEFIDNLIAHTIVVFNRGGVEVFRTTNYQNDWDGTYRGRDLPEGTYWYVIRSEDQEFKGAITIIR